LPIESSRLRQRFSSPLPPYGFLFDTTTATPAAIFVHAFAQRQRHLPAALIFSFEFIVCHRYFDIDGFSYFFQSIAFAAERFQPLSQDNTVTTFISPFLYFHTVRQPNSAAIASCFSQRFRLPAADASLPGAADAAFLFSSAFSQPFLQMSLHFHFIIQLMPLHDWLICRRYAVTLISFRCRPRYTTLLQPRRQFTAARRAAHGRRDCRSAD